MKRYKVSILGDEGVGKSSLFERWVHGTFSDRYLTTIGVCIRRIPPQESQSEIVLWDVAGGAGRPGALDRYIAGSQVCILVGDGTRIVTCEHLDLYSKIVTDNGAKVISVINKWDVASLWSPDALQLPQSRISARTGFGLHELLSRLHRTLEGDL